MTIEANLEKVNDRIRLACEACGRSADEVQLVAVSKRKPVEAVREAFESGQQVFGENRIQEVMVKQPELPNALRWHLIGHLQSNKVKQAAHCRFDLIHSVDSLKILKAVNRESGEQGRVQPVLIQVNISGEASKYGIEPQDLEGLLEEANACHHLDVQGLMTIPPFTKDPEDAGPHFQGLRELRDRMTAATGYELPELSMGMSHDLEVAIREGATYVRVGTDIFGERT